MSHPTKVCIRCEEEKPVECYSPDRRNNDGLQGKCNECFKADREAKRAKDPEKYKKDMGRWSKENRDKVNAYRTKRRNSDPAYALAERLRSRTLKAMHGIGKTDSTMRLLGCSMEEFKKHLESTFTEGMSWERRDELHIDHVRPCASFDLLQESEQRKCFHYTNLQFLWATDNLKKSDKYDG
jgi:hypothetical protein